MKVTVIGQRSRSQYKKKTIFKYVTQSVLTCDLVVKDHGVKVKSHWVKVTCNMAQGQIRSAYNNSIIVFCSNVLLLLHHAAYLGVKNSLLNRFQGGQYVSTCTSLQVASVRASLG